MTGCVLCVCVESKHTTMMSTVTPHTRSKRANDITFTRQSRQFSGWFPSRCESAQSLTPLVVYSQTPRRRSREGRPRSWGDTEKACTEHVRMLTTQRPHSLLSELSHQQRTLQRREGGPSSYELSCTIKRTSCFVTLCLDKLLGLTRESIV